MDDHLDDPGWSSDIREDAALRLRDVQISRGLRGLRCKPMSWMSCLGTPVCNCSSGFRTRLLDSVQFSDAPACFVCRPCCVWRFSICGGCKTCGKTRVGLASTFMLPGTIGRRYTGAHGLVQHSPSESDQIACTLSSWGLLVGCTRIPTV